MSEIRRILDQMDRAFSGDAWHGPSLTVLLDGISARDASRHPVARAHSIWELVHHLRAWNDIVERRLQNESVDPTPEMDWPAVGEVTESAWQRTLNDLGQSRARLRQAVEQLQETRLEEKTGNSRDSCYVMLHGLVQHDLYHAGQIAVLKKAL